MTRLTAVCVAFVCCIICVSVNAAASSSNDALPPHLSQVFNPLNKKHAVSRSTYHTDQGIVRDTYRAYANQGQSHIDHAFKPHIFSLEQGVHLWDPVIYNNVTALAKQTFGSIATLPTIEAASKGVPEQIKISLTQRQGEMVVNWLTWNTTQYSTVKYGLSSGEYTFTTNGTSFAFVDPNTLHIIRYIHNTLLVDLSAMTTYYYIVGDGADVWSDEMKFTTLSDGANEDIITLAVFGDMGVVNSVSMQALSDEVAAGTVQAVLHVGDYAYNMDEIQGLTGDIFLEEMQNITSAVPYMGTMGNHEGK